MINYPQQKNNQGFVILFAVLISSLILLISVGIFNTVQKEVILSSSAQESQAAFYAADSALECALYADQVGVGSPNPSTPFTITPTSGNNATSFDCGGSEVTSYYLASSGGTQFYEYPYVFRYYNTLSDGGCSYVLIEKELKGTSQSGEVAGTETRITAVGFNTCVDSSGGFNGDINIPDFNDPTLLERRISISYVIQPAPVVTP